MGRIPYLNSEPFYHGMNEAGIVLCSQVPRALGRMAERGEVDAAPLSLVDCFRLAERFEPLGDFCIATRCETGSVLLFSKRPLEALGEATVAITGETSTSVHLLKALLKHKYRVSPRAFVSLGESVTPSSSLATKRCGTGGAIRSSLIYSTLA
ncbi:MAG: MqnA/MqnD/SBP family protein [Chloroflexota bacterium]|nr:MqnA/MqnD/SBP family protein [Chloroflexota bacterium]